MEGYWLSLVKKHQIILPYVDENGITHAPRFSVASLLGGAVKNWAEQIYNQIALLKKLESEELHDNIQGIQKTQIDEDPLSIIKIRLAKGEINMEEYEKMKKILENC